MPTTEKCKTFGTVSATTTKANQDEEQVIDGATANQEKTTSLELGDLMAKLEQIDKKLKYSRWTRRFFCAFSVPDVRTSPLPDVQMSMYSGAQLIL